MEYGKNCASNSQVKRGNVNNFFPFCGNAALLRGLQVTFIDELRDKILHINSELGR